MKRIIFTKNKKRALALVFIIMADREGFEPSVRYSRTHAFQACSFNQLRHLSADAAALFFETLFYCKHI